MFPRLIPAALAGYNVLTRSPARRAFRPRAFARVECGSCGFLALAKQARACNLYPSHDDVDSRAHLRRWQWDLA
jgi:hypothetical protein